VVTRILLWALREQPLLLPAIRSIPGVEVVEVADAATLRIVGQGADAVVLMGTHYDAEVAAALREHRGLRLVQFLTSGYEGIARHGVEPGVRVCNAGDVWSAVVAEHAMALLLALGRRIPEILAQQREHRWDRSIETGLRSLDGQCLAVVGFGGIGRQVAKRARGFGMTILGVSRRGAVHALADEMFAATDMASALRRADAVVIGVPLSDDTHHLFDDAAFASLKPGAFLINVSRGGLVDSEALLRALRPGGLAGAALDVTEPEPLPPTSPLWAHPAIIVSPHLGGVGSQQAKQALAAMARQNVERFVRGAELLHVVKDG
jgi:phosphoglycerate dehydrogenase-like enzyme